MSHVMVVPELIEAATADLTSMGSTLGAAHLAAAGPTVGVLPAAADEVSAGIAALFSQHAQEYQKLAEKAGAFHEEFVQRLTASAGAYASAEAANTSLLQPLSAAADTLARVAAAVDPKVIGYLKMVPDRLGALVVGLWDTLIDYIELFPRRPLDAVLLFSLTMPIGSVIALGWAFSPLVPLSLHLLAAALTQPLVPLIGSALVNGMVPLATALSNAAAPLTAALSTAVAPLATALYDATSFFFATFPFVPVVVLLAALSPLLFLELALTFYSATGGTYL
ncbi:PE family protein [Mycobacterium bourgelatii]|uniref:PE domain-containing protein n=2 Tax=Mycobacterium bourgelatii TaxID=1273442 RepID=A0A7I9YJM0_MYCBU|nr:PE family protein [Mycobacterium bourgelatii]GFG88860.1 hypothetical protein MBOU_09020 [Mycobacterium bourgelatii]